MGLNLGCDSMCELLISCPYLCLPVNQLQQADLDLCRIHLWSGCTQERLGCTPYELVNRTRVLKIEMKLWGGGVLLVVVLAIYTYGQVILCK